MHGIDPYARNMNGGALQHIFGKDILTLEFTDFLENWTRASMWIHFRRFGLVINIFVPEKRSHSGNLFGFVRFKGLDNVEKLLKSIRRVNVGPKPITINIAKFQMKGHEEISSVVVKPTTDYHCSPGWKTTTIVPSNKWQLS